MVKSMYRFLTTTIECRVGGGITRYTSTLEVLVKSSMNLNPIPAGGGGVPGNPPPPLIIFGDYSKSIGLRLLIFFTFLTNKYCLNASFYLYPTKSLFRPTSGHWIWTFFLAL